MIGIILIVVGAVVLLLCVGMLNKVRGKTDVGLFPGASQLSASKPAGPGAGKWTLRPAAKHKPEKEKAWPEPIAPRSWVGRRRPCACGTTWPPDHKRAGQRKALMSCCGAALAGSPAGKGWPLLRRLIDLAIARKKAPSTGTRRLPSGSLKQ